MEAGIPGPWSSLKGWDRGFNASGCVTGKGRGLAAHYGLEEESRQSLRLKLERTSTYRPGVFGQGRKGIIPGH